MKSKFKIKTKMKAVRGVAAWALLLALLWPGAKAHGQTDNFFYINESPRDGGSSGTWNGLGMSGDGTGGTGTWDGFGFAGDGTGAGGTWDGFGFAGDGTGMDGTWNPFDFEGDGTETGATWTGFEYGDPLPTGAGLLALTVSGLCYAGLKRRKDSKI